jgi:hypothetical protein
LIGVIVIKRWISSTLSSQVGNESFLGVDFDEIVFVVTRKGSLHAVPDGSNVQTRVNFATSGWTNPQSKEKAAPTIITVGFPWPIQYKWTR